MSLPKILTFSETKKDDFPGFHTWISPFMRIKHFLEEKYNLSFESYYGDDSYTRIASKDVSEGSPRVVLLATLGDGFLSKYYDHENEKIVYASDGYLFYYPEFETAVVDVPWWDERGMQSRTVAFSTNDEQYKTFVTYVEKRGMNRAPDEITMLTDTSRGLTIEQKKVTVPVDRDAIVLNEELKVELFELIDSFFEKENNFFKKYKIPHKRGILLYGKPGNGKTTLIKSIVSSVQQTVLYWQVNEHTRSESISRVFSLAQQYSPCILVIEDMECIAVTSSALRSTFLNAIDGAASGEGVCIIGTTNYPDAIDPGFINRSGRFDQTFELAPPSYPLRKAYMKKRGFADFLTETELEDAAVLADEFSYCHLNELFVYMVSQVHLGKKFHIQKKINEIKKDLKKQKEHKFFEDDQKRVGF